METKYYYVACSEKDVPGNVRFDVPAYHQGRMVEVAYGGFGRAAHDYGDPFKRVTEPGGAVTYYRLADGPPRLRMGGPP